MTDKSGPEGDAAARPAPPARPVDVAVGGDCGQALVRYHEGMQAGRRLPGRRVVIAQDNDDASRKHALDVA